MLQDQQIHQPTISPPHLTYYLQYATLLQPGPTGQPPQPTSPYHMLPQLQYASVTILFQFGKREIPAKYTVNALYDKNRCSDNDKNHLNTYTAEYTIHYMLFPYHLQYKAGLAVNPPPLGVFEMPYIDLDISHFSIFRAPL